MSPSFYDVPSYLRLIQDISSAFVVDPDLSGLKLRFVLIDDTGGADPDLERLKLLNPNVEIISPPYNLGHQRALVFGLRKLSGRTASGDIVLTLDSDGEDRPVDVPRLVKALIGEVFAPNRIVIARRTRRRESLRFRIFYQAFKGFFFLLTGVVVRSGNFAAFYGSFLEKLIFHPHFDLCYSSSLLSFGLNRQFIPCERGIRYAGTSKMSFQRLAIHGIRMLMPFVDRVAIRAFVLSVMTFLLGVSALLAIVAIRIFTPAAAIPGWATYTSILSLLLSFTALSNFVVLFVFFSQNQSFSLSGLDRHES